jgi:pimeloyl-ACP methyl ester carboxylesterase
MRNRADFTNLIANFESDFLIIQGENDSMVTKDLMEKMISEFTIKYVLIKEVGHMAHIQSPLVVKDSICKYILNSNS